MLPDYPNPTYDQTGHRRRASEVVSTPSNESTQSHYSSHAEDLEAATTRPRQRSLEKLPNVISAMRDIGRRISTTAVPMNKSTPDRGTVVLALLFFFGFIIIGALAVRFPIPMMQVLFLCSAAAIFLALLGRCAVDMALSQGFPYSRNTGNTVLIVLLTFVVGSILYAKQWYPGLRHVDVVIQSEPVEQVRLPNIDIIHDSSQSFQADLVGPENCWIGGSNTATESCNEVNVTEVTGAPTKACDCQEAFDGGVKSIWSGTSDLNAISFRPKKNLVIGKPSVSLNIQFNFTYRTPDPASGPILSPWLGLLIFDPELEPFEVINKGIASPIPFSANSFTSIKLDLNWKNVGGLPPHYEYSPMISTVPFMGMNCGAADRGSAGRPCTATLQLSFSSLQQTNYSERPKYTLGDVAGLAASYFALVQFLAWVFSGQVVTI